MAKSLKLLLLESYRKFLKEDVSPDVIERFKNLPNDELCNLIVTNRIDKDIFDGLFRDFISSKYYANDEDGDEKRDALAMELIASKYATADQLKAFIDSARVHKADKFRVKEAMIKYQAKMVNRNYVANAKKDEQLVTITDDIKELEFISIHIIKNLISRKKLTKKEFIEFFNLFMSSKFYNNLSNGTGLRGELAGYIIPSTILTETEEDKKTFKALLRKFISPKFKKIHQCDNYYLRSARNREQEL